jgi:hypothetical protein
MEGQIRVFSELENSKFDAENNETTTSREQVSATLIFFT